jgi:hypothetical protein
MAEVERVLHELALFARRSTPDRSSPANEAPKAPSLVPAPPPIDRLVLDPGLDFIFHKGGMIELTEAGFRRMGQAHSAGLDTAIEVDRRYLLHYPASKPKFAGAAASWGQVQRGLSTPVLILAPRRQFAGAFQTIVKEFERRIPIASAEK